jgi:hypothetical protein
VACLNPSVRASYRAKVNPLETERYYADTNCTINRATVLISKL